MTVRCQLLVLLFLVSSVVSGPTRSAAESPDGSSSPPGSEAPGQAMTPQQSEAPTPVQEPPTTAPSPPPPEQTTKSGPEVIAKISLTEPNVAATDPLTAAPPPASETASSATPETSARQISSEDTATTEQERCEGQPTAVGDADGAASETCGPSSSKDSESSSTNNSCIVDDQEYPDGARVSGPQDPCRPCFCHRKRVTCVELRCYTRKGCKPLFKAGVCCPTYDHCPPVPLVNASSETERSDGNPEDSDDTTGLESVTTDQLTDESVAALVDSASHKDDDSVDESTISPDQDDDDDGDDHDHSHHHHKQHHMLDRVTPLTSSATTLRPGTSFPFLVRGRAGVEVR